MEIDQPEDETARISDVLRNLTAPKAPLPTSVAKLSGSSRIIPSGKDFHFYNNFNEFKSPIVEIDNKSKHLLGKIGASELFSKPMPLPDDKDVELDDDVSLDWLVNVNDEIFEMFDVSLDEFKAARKKEEESGVRTMRVDEDEENGFQMVYGKKDKKLERNVEGVMKGAQEVKVATKVKPKIPFHVPTITKPQEEFKIIVNNVNQPFEHVWLQRSEDGSRFMHPLENLSVMDFVDTSESMAEPVKPLPLEVTPFKLVEEVKDLKQLAIKLRSVNEFAVDLEHNQYRSFQGLTCLMQISTRTEDFVIDTLKLRIHIGPYLRDLFKDPSKRKVLHGADRDIVWLQRDFGIYICNMFDTGQASRVLKMERFSLEHLLDHFCGVKANKEYQNADWRIRPLPREMIKYAREDTHYLLYIYDLMRARLLELPAESESSDPPLVEVYKRSYDICTQLYEKELLTEASYLHIYGLVGADLTAQQLAIVSGLFEWRDVVARAEDESTGYVLPNRTLIEIAKQMPLTTNQLRRSLKSKLPYIERNLGAVVSVIRHSIQNAAAFEEAAKYLRERRLESINGENALAPEDSEVPSEASEIPKTTVEVTKKQSSSSNAKLKLNEDGKTDYSAHKRAALPEDTHAIPTSSHSAQVTVQLLKKPSRAFGAMLGNSAKRKFDPDRSEKEEAKLEQIKSTVSLPFHSFSGKDEPKVEESIKTAEVVQQEDPPSAPPPTGSSVPDIIILDDSDDEQPVKDTSDAKQPDNIEEEEGTDSDISKDDEPMSLSDLSSSFEQCFPPLDQSTSSKVTDKSQASDAFLPEVEPFDYEAARKEVTFGLHQPRAEGDDTNRRRDKKKGSAAAKEESADYPQGRRRQAFPASGNRSATFR